MLDLFGNTTQIPPRNWRAEPSTRGTWNILSTCLITLSLCLWTALHLNIPRHKEATWRPILWKTRWLLIGLLAPEMIAYTAWCQRRAAGSLEALVKHKLKQRPSTSRMEKIASFFRGCYCLKRKSQEATDIELDDHNSGAWGTRHTWSKTHSFYALMGGFVFDTSDTKVNFLPNGRQRLTLTPRGLIYLLEHEPDLLPNISEDHIRDKSKSNRLAKTLVCLQALWFCAQCVVRCAQGLAISSLELNVFAHAICALLMYCLWWSKPLDIEEPTALSGTMVQEMCAFMCMRSSPSRDERESCPPELPYGVRYGSDRESNIAEASAGPITYTEAKWYRLDKSFAHLIVKITNEINLFRSDSRPRTRLTPRTLGCRLDWTGTDPDLDNRTSGEIHGCPIDLVFPEEALDFSPPNSFVQQMLTSEPQEEGARDTTAILPHSFVLKKDVDGFKLTLGAWELTQARERIFVPKEQHPEDTQAFVKLCPSDVIRWRLCSRALRQYHPKPNWSKHRSNNSHQTFPAYGSVYERARNWPSPDQLDITAEDQGFLNLNHMWLGFSCAGLMYGGLHLLAWNAPFTSTSDCTLWRGSGVLLASSGFFVFFVCVFIASYGDMRSWFQERPLLHFLRTRFGTWYSIFAKLVRVVESLFSGLLMMIIGLFLGAYIAARVYLVVQSFSQLAYLPKSAYILPSWSQYYPHIT